ncbi:lipopolysaccharide biosynthesis protein [Roseovarius azorensis]|nr:lipopolysaccharide biosynthesis protein [Roseovarius azorensis]
MRAGRSRSAVVGVLWSSLHTAIPIIGSTLIFYVSALYLSPADLGLFGLASSLVMTAIAVSPVAFGEALVQRKTISKSNADSVFWMTMAVGLVLMTSVLLAAPSIARWAGESAISTLLPVLGLRIPLEMSVAVPNAMIVRSMKFKLVALRTSVATTVSLVITLTLLWAGYGYWALVISQLSSSLVICVMVFWTSGWRPGLSFDLCALRELTGYGLYASGTRMLTTMRLDHIILGALGGTAMLGFYFFAQKLYLMLTQFVGGALSSVTHALLSSLQEDQEKTTRAFFIASFSAAAVSLPMFSLLLVLTPDIVALLFDPQWQGAGFTLQMFCVIGCLAGISVVQGAFIRSQGKANWWFFYQLIQQATSLLVIALTFSAGLKTLMVVFTLKSLLVWPISVIMTARLLGIGFFTYLSVLVTPAVTTLAMLAAVLAAPHLTPDLSPVASLAARIAIAVVTYLTVLGLIAKDRITEIFHLVLSGRRQAT